MPNYRYHMADAACRTGCAPRPMPKMEPCRERTESVCGCRSESPGKEHMPVAMAYVPWQEWRKRYGEEQGLQRGTIFEELDKPFRGAGGCCYGR